MMHRKKNQMAPGDGTAAYTNVPAASQGQYVQQPEPGAVSGAAAPGSSNYPQQKPGYGYDTNVPQQKAGYGNQHVQNNQVPESYPPGYVAPMDPYVKRKRSNRAANWCAAAFVACWACTWPCHGPCCCGL